MQSVALMLVSSNRTHLSNFGSLFQEDKAAKKTADLDAERSQKEETPWASAARVCILIASRIDDILSSNRGSSLGDMVVLTTDSALLALSCLQLVQLADAKKVERMLNQNTYDDVLQDFKYWEDPTDEFKVCPHTLSFHSGISK
jgi:hypothetical protein